MLVVCQVLLEVLLVTVQFQRLADVLAVVHVWDDALFGLFRLCGVFRSLEVILIEVLLDLFAFLKSSQVLITTSTNIYIFCLIFS